MAIKQINIEGIWGGKGDIHWDNIHPDVNILVGSNGSGKSTLLNILRFLLLGNTKELKELVKNVTVCVGEGMIRYEVSEKSVLWETKNSFDVYYVNTFDIPSAKTAVLADRGILCVSGSWNMLSAPAERTKQIDIVLCIVTHQLLAVTAISRTGTVFQNFPVDVPYRFNRDFRSRQVGLTDVQVKYMYTPLLGSICQRSQFSDRRCGHLHSANRYCWHEVYLLFDDL